MRWLVRVLFFCVCFAVVPGCSGASDEVPRRVWLQNTLIEDNRPVMLRAPDLTAGKFIKMGLTPYNYYRGTAGQYWRDVRGPGEWAWPTAYGDAATSDVLLVGDPHPENVGSYLAADGEVALDYNDFDGARRGPYHFDVRRLAIGFLIAGGQIGLTPERTRDIAEASVRGYVEQIARTTPYRIQRNDGFGPVVDDIFRRAIRDGDIREELLEYTEVGDDGVRTVIDTQIDPPTVEGVIGDEVLVVEDDERAFVERLLADYWDTVVDPPPLGSRTVHGVARRYGAGVSSYPLQRWYVLVEGETVDVEDDVLLEVKEIFDPPALASSRQPRVQYRVNAERVVEIQRTLQTTKENDPYLGWAADGQHSFRVRHRTKYQKDADVGRLGEDLGTDWTEDDLVLHAEVYGALLAATHRRGAPEAADRIAALVDEAFVTETMDFAVAYAEQVLEDHQTLLTLMDEDGPLLGFVDREVR